MSSENQKPDTSPIYHLIRRARVLLRSTWVATGVSVTIGLMLLCGIIVLLADIAFVFNSYFRLFGLIAIIIPTVWIFSIGVIRPLLRRLMNVTVARRIERELPGIHNRLVSCVDLEDPALTRNHSEVFHRRLIREVLERIRGFRMRSILSLGHLQKAGAFGLTLLVINLFLFGLFPSQLSTAVARIMQPFADIPPATGVVFEVFAGDQTEPGDFESLRGEPIQFRAVLLEGEVDPPGGDTALRMVLQTTDDDGTPRELKFEFGELEDNQAKLELTGMRQSFTYRVYGAGTWTRERKVTLLDRPDIVSVQVATHYPEYMRRPDARLNPPEVLDVKAPTESRLVVQLDVEGNATEGEIQFLETRLFSEKVKDRPERPWFRARLPQGVKAVGKWAWNNELAVDELTSMNDGEAEGRAQLHSVQAKSGVKAHGFQNAPVGFEISDDEHLFVYVLIDGDDPPTSIMVNWHDGKNWEHRVYWGADAFKVGKPDTESKRKGGELPEKGKLVRLTIPADQLGLAGKKVFGLNFSHDKGKCYWGPVGSLPAPTRSVEKLVVSRSFPIKRESLDESGPRDSSKWIGEMQLLKNGFYRVQVKNRIGYTNQQMSEGTIEVLDDLPPQIYLEQPGRDLTVSKPVSVPLFAWSSDDYGLAEIVLDVQTKDGSFRGMPVDQFDNPERTVVSVATLDLAALGFKVGDTVRYRTTARDTKGQTASTKDFTIRIAESKDAADVQLEQYQQQTDRVTSQLDELVQSQQKVQQALDQLAEKAKPLQEKVDAAQEQNAAESNAENGQASQDGSAKNEPPELTDLPLTEEEKKLLEEVRAELAKLTELEKQNLAKGQQIANELKQLAENAKNQPLLPNQLGNQLENMEKAFQPSAVDPLQQLKDMTEQGASDQQRAPDVNNIQETSKQVGENLQDAADRLKALSEAQKGSQQNAQEALEQFRQDMVQQDAQQAERGLESLRDFVQQTREQLRETEGEQKQLNQKTASTQPNKIDDLAPPQQDVDAKANSRLNDAANLLDQIREVAEAAGDLPPLANQQNMQSQNATTEQGDSTKKKDAGKSETKAGKQDGGKQDDKAAAKQAEGKKSGKDQAGKQPAGKQPAGKQEGGKQDAGKQEAGKQEAGKQEAGKGQPGAEQPPAGQEGDAPAIPELNGDKSLFEPALGGEAPTTDPELARQMASLAEQIKQQSKTASPAKRRKQAMQARQLNQTNELDQAERALGADQAKLEELISQLGQAQQGEMSDQQTQDLANFLGSEAMQEAMQMASRMQQMKGQPASSLANQSTPPSTPGQQQPPTPNNLPQGLPPNSVNPESLGPSQTVDAILLDLDALDADSRAVILKMQPKAREQLLQGLKEEGPEGYREFIREYFRQLTKAQSKKKKP